MKRFNKILIWVLAMFAVMLVVLILVSPYKRHSNEFRTVEASIEINAPIDSVFAYMTSSAYASDWSSYVDHITPLNPEEFADGEKNSVRRVFVSANEKEAHWDEKIVKVIPNEYRKIAIFDINGLAMSAEGLQTEQRYEKVSSGVTRLSLVLYFDKEHTGLWNGFKMRIGSFKIRSIFEKNLESIKREIEAK